MSGVLSLTIVGFYAAIKTAIRSLNQEIHYEFLSKRSMTKAGSPGRNLQRFLELSRDVKIVELRVTRGSDMHEEKANVVANSLNLDSNELYIPPPQTLLAILKIVGPLNVMLTSSLVNEHRFARVIENDMPHALKFKVVKWFKPGDNIKGTTGRVPYGMSQFGFAQNGLPNYD